MSVWEAIENAERILPGKSAAENEVDPRWQAIIKVGDFVRDAPDAIWPFIVRWGSWADKDLCDAVATCLLEHLLQYHFDRFFPLVEEVAQSDSQFAETFLGCWKLGQAAEPANAERFDVLRAECQRRRRRTQQSES